MDKNKVNPIMNHKVMVDVKLLGALTFEFKGQGHQEICPWEGVDQRRVVYKYQVKKYSVVWKLWQKYNFSDRQFRNHMPAFGA